MSFKITIDDMRAKPKGKTHSRIKAIGGAHPYTALGQVARDQAQEKSDLDMRFCVEVLCKLATL
jgi:hypothetical protein